MLAKAEKIISQVNLNSSRRPSSRVTASANETKKAENAKLVNTKPESTKNIVEAVKLSSRSSTSQRLNTKQNTPVYMNAPYRTDPVTGFKRSKSVTSFEKEKPLVTLPKAPVQTVNLNIDKK